MTVYYRDGKTRKRVFPECGSERFGEVVRNRLVGRYREVRGEPRDAKLRIEVIRSKKKRVSVKKLNFTAFEMVFRMHGDEELIRLGYEGGIGKMNSMGFEMLTLSPSKREDSLF